jgi:1-deoxy-D-xylulose-5-phosphate reductoisomerase
MMTSTTRRVAILGATGSIGTAAAVVVDHLRQVDGDSDWILYGISGHANLDLLSQLAAKHQPSRVVISDSSIADAWRSKREHATVVFPNTCSLAFGAEQLIQLAADPEVDIVVAAIVGRAGLESTVEAVRAGKRVALANKETLVVAGSVVYELLKTSTASIYPVDSEHSAIFQCLAGRSSPKRIILTASGGPFRDWTTEQMRSATIDQAMAHPTWRMGRKITIDSATMMNKALEIIEARWLFDVPAEQIDVVVHPQSIIHSMIETQDGSVIAQLSPPDMRLPIQHALTYPKCIPGTTESLDFTKNLNLTLLPVDTERFPAISLGFAVAKAGGTAGAVVNAANEEAVGLFLEGRIRFTDIVQACQMALEHHNHETNVTIERLLELDRWARAEVRRWQARSNSS